ncbi:MAG: hypothetical protein AB4063_23960, partial [Crocosphaera sp.]
QIIKMLCQREKLDPSLALTLQEKLKNNFNLENQLLNYHSTSHSSSHSQQTPINNGIGKTHHYYKGDTHNTKPSTQNQRVLVIDEDYL